MNDIILFLGKDQGYRYCNDDDAICSDVMLGLPHLNFFFNPLPFDHLYSQNGDDEWSVDTSEEAVKARTDNLSEHISTLTLAGDVELSTSQRVDKFFKFVDVS